MFAVNSTCFVQNHSQFCLWSEYTVEPALKDHFSMKNLSIKNIHFCSILTLLPNLVTFYLYTMTWPLLYGPFS